MSKKRDRVEAISRLIASEKIHTQEGLLERLSKNGFNVTQATLSRDLKELGVAKVPDSEMGYIYVMPSSLSQASKHLSLMNVPTESVVWVEFTHSFAVLKTHAGFASSVAIFIDHSKMPEIIGTLAGDDTILIINRENYARNEILKALRRLFPGLKEH